MPTVHPPLQRALSLLPLIAAASDEHDAVRKLTPDSHILATGYFFHGDYEASLNAGKNLVRMRPGVWFGYRHCCAALTELGRIDEARYYAGQLFSRFAGELTSCGSNASRCAARRPTSATRQSSVLRAG